jgi:methylenetetrahydrofolate dehydrogenase (NADP+)/methenyltetrahydrofolate cyclohydrolase
MTVDNKTARRIDGKVRAEEIHAEARQKAQALRARGVVPTLAMMRIGDDPASVIYLRKKSEASAAVGVDTREVVLPADADPEEARARMRALNDDAAVHGILLQLPLPKGFDAGELLDLMAPEKDVDGFHPLNVGRLVRGEPAFVPCTPLGIHYLILREGIDLAGKVVAVMGRSNVVGRPLANLLSQKGPGLDATVILLHTRSREPERLTRMADVLVAAAGAPGVVTANMVKPGAVVIDVGIHRVPHPTEPGKTRLVGDVASEVADVASALTPVPGGVGPMTVAMLMRNTVDAAAGGRTRPFERRG